MAAAAQEPQAVAVSRETIELAFIVAVQQVPPQGRAALLLRDVLGWSAADSAALLDVSVAALNSSLQRARAVLQEHLAPDREAWSAAYEGRERELVERYVAVHEQHDEGQLLALLAENARWAMPPDPVAITGRARMYAAWQEGGFGTPAFGDMRCVVTRANGQPAIGVYRRRAVRRTTGRWRSTCCAWPMAWSPRSHLRPRPVRRAGPPTGGVMLSGWRRRARAPEHVHADQHGRGGGSRRRAARRPGIRGVEMAGLAVDLRELGRPWWPASRRTRTGTHLLWHPELGTAPLRHRPLRRHRPGALSGPGAMARVAGMLPPEIADEVGLDLLGDITGLPAGATLIPWDGPEVRIIEHQAHAPGHASLWIEERAVLLAADMLSDILIPFLDLGGAADPVEDHLAALRLLEAVEDEAEVVVPGHGSVGGGDQVRARIDLDRAYLRALRDDGDLSDPRLAPPAYGAQWLPGIHERQRQAVAARSGDGAEAQ